MGISKQTRSDQLDTGQVHIMGTGSQSPEIGRGE